MPPSAPRRSLLSRLLTGVDRLTSHPQLVLLVLVTDVAWIAYSVAARFPTRIEAVFQTMVAALTLAMVFLIQHTQSRQQSATQRKLDEILQALPGADNTLLSLEQASDQELRTTRDTHQAIRQAALDHTLTEPDD